jgi:hypothetical protein
MKTKSNKKLSPERLKKIKRINKLVKEVRDSWIMEKYFND